jgi:hypothetical protein
MRRLWITGVLCDMGLGMKVTQNETGLSQRKPASAGTARDFGGYEGNTLCKNVKVFILLTRKMATQARPILSKEIVPWNGLFGEALQSV